ncbi:unnamed protein product [Rotaria socialis]|uniref:Uncharacterized protein n=3 Tax=Rotaria socialis TaxID=392032 RepID=A0A820MSD6_9BILA|nr:unnamed protein product [Rotaria socialis]
MGVNSLPSINFTDTILSNRMIEALNDILVAKDGYQVRPFDQLRQQLKQQASNIPQLGEPQEKFYVSQFPDEQQQFYQPQLSEQQTFYQPQMPDNKPQQPFYQPQMPDNKPHQPFYHPQMPDNKPQQPFYQPPISDNKPQQPFYQPQFPEKPQQPFFQPQFPENKPQQPPYQPQFPENKPQPPFYQPQIPENKPQQPFYQPQFPENKPQQPPYQPQFPENKPQQPFYQPQFPENKPQQPPYQPQFPENKPQQPPYQPQFPENKPQQPFYQPQFPGEQPQQPFYQPQQPDNKPQQPFYQPQFPENKPQQPFYQPQTPEYQPSQHMQQSIPQHQLPASQHQQNPQYSDSQGYYYPFQHQNVNWYNFPSLWTSVASAKVDPAATSASNADQASDLGTSSECPVGLCPRGASCSQLSGQWQCGCGASGCLGIPNPCGIYGRYYFPYYPDASRFIQCDQTGVFWIRKCAPDQPQLQQQEPIPIFVGPSQKSQLYSMASQYKPPTVFYNGPFKNNHTVQSSSYDMQTMDQTMTNNSYVAPSSLGSANPLLQLSLASQHQHQQQHMNTYFDQSQAKKKKFRNQPSVHTAYTDQSFPLYNSKTNHSTGKNRHGATTDDARQNKMANEENETKSDWVEWLSQPLCLGLTRCSGAILFGAMGFLACGSLAGLIASIVLYSQDSNANSQWKLLGMVICSIMLITIIATLLIFICCYKHGFMINVDDEDDPIDLFRKSDGKQYERQQDTLRNYKFNPGNDSTPMPSNILQDVSTPKLLHTLTIQVNDKQTNTETTISQIRPKDFNHGVWPLKNAYGGVSYRPPVPPKMASRYIQAVPHEIDETLEPPQITYQIVAPASAIPSKNILPRMIQTSDDDESAIETTRKQQPNVVREAQKHNIVVQRKNRIEYVHGAQPETNRLQYDDTDEEESQHIHKAVTNGKRQQQPQQHIEYFDTDEEETNHQEQIDVKHKQPHRIEYVDTKEERPHRIAKQPQYDVVEDVIERARSSSIDDIDDASKEDRKRGRKKHKKHGVGKKVTVKHIKANK